MGNQLKRFGLIALLITAILVILTYVLFGSGEDSETLAASGTIEALEVNIVVETAGRIAEVLVDAGDQVQAGDVIIRFEDVSLQAQLDQAETILTQARIEYDLIAAQPLREQRQVDIATAQIELIEAQQALQDLIDNSDLSRAQALKAIEDAEQALEDLFNPELQQTLALENIARANQEIDDAEKHLRIVNSAPSQSAIDQAYANMLMAENKVKKTNDDIELAEQKLKFGPEHYWPKNLKQAYRGQLRKLIRNLEVKLAWDQLAYQNAIEKFNELLKPTDPIEVAVVEAELAVATAQLTQSEREYQRIKDGPSEADIAVLETRIDTAKRDFEALRYGPDPDDLALAFARVKRAEAKLALAQTDMIEEQLAAAQAQVNAAEAALGVIQTQLDRLVLTAPVDGTVLYRFVEAGEVVVPGDSALVLADLNELNLTVYVPENQIREIKPGGRAMISQNSFPKENFTGTITRIAQRTESAPLNVQKDENTMMTVIAVELTVGNLDGRLKPGMSVDVVFGER